MSIERMQRTREVSEETGIPEATLRWWRHTGQGPKSFKVGKKTVMYRRSDVLAWLEEQYKASVPA